MFLLMQDNLSQFCLKSILIKTYKYTLLYIFMKSKEIICAGFLIHMERQSNGSEYL